MGAGRAIRNLFTTDWSIRRVFDRAALASIESAVTQAEQIHGGEIRFAIEAGLSATELLRGTTARQRALQVFAQLGVWDTAANNGVLIYVLWADRDVEIVADRGFNGIVTSEQWGEVCRRMEALFAQQRAPQAVVEGIRVTAELIARHYPAADRNELPNQPVLL